MDIFPVANGIFWIEIPEAELYILCGCPADAMKHLKKRGLIMQKVENGVFFESGPNAILLSDVSIQKGEFANLAEFPLLHMMFMQGMSIPGHPNNRGRKPVLIGSPGQIRAQSDYFFRGQYGLASYDEILESGVSEGFAREFFRIKSSFAFHDIKKPGEQTEACVVENRPVEIKNGVFIEREAVNVFRITYKGKSLPIDLNLGENDRYEPAVQTDFHSIHREYFSIIHIGEGNGWDINKPCMGSIITFQGRIYLIDTGPYITHSLQALGISINEIEGIFHTHGHDDHFAGLTSLMYTDHRIKYYATRMVRESVMKKLAELTGISQRNCERSFEINDLKFNRWNDVDGLSVMPFYSPHPVENNVYLFRTPWDGGYRQYMHLADIASLDLLKKMLIDDPEAGDYSRKIYEQMHDLFRKPVDIKKVDIGGGMIHGSVEDFAEDRRSKILLSHTDEKLSFQQKEIGSSALFGRVDTLIPSTQDYFKQSAFRYLREYYPEAPVYEINMLLNSEIRNINVGDIIQKKGEGDGPVLLVLSGVVEIINSGTGKLSTLSAGSFIGESCVLFSRGSVCTYRAASYVRLLTIPPADYSGFIGRTYDLESYRKLHVIALFLQETQLFGELISSVAQQRISRLVKENAYPAGHEILRNEGDSLFLIHSGTVHLSMEQRIVEEIGPGDFFGEDYYFYSSSLFSFTAVNETRVYRIPLDPLRTIPVVEWKMLERFQRRLTAFGTLSQIGQAES